MPDKNKEIRIHFRDKDIGYRTIKGSWWFVNDDWLMIEQDTGNGASVTVFSAPQESILCVYVLESKL